MKKLIVLMVALAAACAVQAAAVKWNSGSFSNGFKDPDGKTMKGQTGYEMIVTFFSDAAGETSLGTSSDTSASALGAFNGTFSDYDFQKSTTYYASAIIKSSTASLETDIVSFTIAEDGSDSSINFTTGAGLDSAAKAWKSTGWTGGGSTGTPEPTSALLMLVGGSLLALRRKQR